MRAPRLPFSLLLPALDLALWVILALIPATLYYFAFLADAQDDHHAITLLQRRQLNVQPEEVARAELEVAMESRSHALVAINLPGLAVEAVTSIGDRWPESWHPEAIGFVAWRALVYPIFALPAWWLAGVSLDALWGRRRISSLAVWLAGLLFLFCALMAAVGSILGAGGDPADAARAAGFALWAGMFALAPFAWWKQRRRDRQLAEAELARERPIQQEAYVASGDEPYAR